MKHIDEQTLELLVLRDARVKRREKQITKHLAECVGCAQLFAQIEEFYADVRLEGSRSPSELRPMVQRSLVRKRNELEPYFAPAAKGIGRYTEVVVPTFWHRVESFGRRHPVSSLSSFLALAAMLYLSLAYLLRGNSNPAYYYYDVPNHRIEVYNSGDKLLWSKNAMNLADARSDARFTNTSQTVMSDLDNDGRNELLTVVEMPQDPNPHLMREFGPDGEVERTFSFPAMKVNFRGTEYDTPFCPNHLLKVQMPDGTTNILVESNNGRSPTILARLDTRLHIVGEYWHFGNFFPYLISTAPGKPAMVALAGSDDIADISGNDVDFLVVLNPDKIVGKHESSATRGFGYPVSNAEEYYIRFPRTDLEKTQGMRLNVMIEPDMSDSLFYVGLKSSYQMLGHDSFGFDFVMNKMNMAVREVKFISNAEMVYAKLKREGRVHGTFDERYLENLKDAVRYWDGSEWVKTPTRIGHALVSAK